MPPITVPQENISSFCPFKFLAMLWVQETCITVEWIVIFIYYFNWSVVFFINQEIMHHKNGSNEVRRPHNVISGTLQGPIQYSESPFANPKRLFDNVTNGWQLPVEFTDVSTIAFVILESRHNARCRRISGVCQDEGWNVFLLSFARCAGRLCKDRTRRYGTEQVFEVCFEIRIRKYTSIRNRSWPSHCDFNETSSVVDSS